MEGSRGEHKTYEIIDKKGHDKGPKKKKCKQAYDKEECTNNERNPLKFYYGQKITRRENDQWK